MTSKTIEKKTHPEFFELVLAGKKNFEIRLAEFECEEGDTLFLREWDPERQEYTGRSIQKKVTYVTNTKNHKHWDEKEIEDRGLLVIGFRDCEEDNRMIVGTEQMDEKNETLERRIAIRKTMPTIPDPTVNASEIAIKVRLLKELRAKLEVKMNGLGLDEDCKESIRRAIELVSTIDVKNATKEKLMDIARLASSETQD